MFELCFGGHAVLQGDQRLGAARLANKWYLCCREAGREFPDTQPGDSKSVEQFEIREHRIFGSFRVRGGDLVGGQGQALERDFGLAQQSVQDAVVK